MNYSAETRCLKWVLPLLLLLLCQPGKAQVISENSGYIPPDFLSYPIDDMEGLAYYEQGVLRSFDFTYRDGRTIFFFVYRHNDPDSWFEGEIHRLDKIAAEMGYDKRKFDAVEHILQPLNKKTLRQLSADFDIYVYHLPKADMTATPELDAPYTEKIPRVEYVFRLDFENNRIRQIDRVEIRNEKDRRNCQTWLIDFLSDRYGY